MRINASQVMMALTKSPLILTGLQPGERAAKATRNRFNGFLDSLRKPLKRFLN